jgi:23S rRNA (guanosine2251-2'-O)-methyltransferase
VNDDAVWLVGFHAVLGALEGDRPVEVVWLQQGRRDGRARRVEAAAHRRGVPVRVVPRARLDKLADGGAHTGCAARVGAVAWCAPGDLVAPDGRPGRLLLLDDVTDPHNVGAVIRTCVAFGVDGLILAGPSAPPLAGAASRAAAGLVDRIPIARTTVAADALVALRGEGYWAFGADAAGTPVAEVSVPDRWVVCIGSEERGLRAKTRSVVDEWVAVPMAAGVESLNLSVSAAVLLYELLRTPTGHA